MRSRTAANSTPGLPAPFLSRVPPLGLQHVTREQPVGFARREAGRRDLPDGITDDIDTADFLAEAEATLDQYTAVAPPGPSYPPRLIAPIGALLRTSATETRAFALDLLGIRAQRTPST